MSLTIEPRSDSCCDHVRCRDWKASPRLCFPLNLFVSQEVRDFTTPVTGGPPTSCRASARSRRTPSHAARRSVPRPPKSSSRWFAAVGSVCLDTDDAVVVPSCGGFVLSSSPPQHRKSLLPVIRPHRIISSASRGPNVSPGSTSTAPKSAILAGSGSQ